MINMQTIKKQNQTIQQQKNQQLTIKIVETKKTIRKQNKTIRTQLKFQ